MTGTPSWLPAGSQLSSSTRSTRPTPRRCGARSAGEARPAVDHGRGGRRRGAAARAAAGPREPGNLYASLLQTLACPPAVVPAAVAGRRRRRRSTRSRRRREAVRRPAPQVAQRHSDRRRPSARGILVESTSRPPHAGIVAVIGIGLNLVSAPDDLGRAATTSRRTASALSPPRRCWASWPGHAATGSKSGTTARALRACARPGSSAPAPSARALTVNAAAERIAGSFVGLDDGGALLMRRRATGAQRSSPSATSRLRRPPRETTAR